jgi:hypothetical protein
VSNFEGLIVGLVEEVEAGLGVRPSRWELVKFCSRVGRSRVILVFRNFI